MTLDLTTESHKTCYCIERLIKNVVVRVNEQHSTFKVNRCSGVACH